jgi:hypothetical protein
MEWFPGDHSLSTSESRFQLSADTWAVILSLVLALLVKLHVIGVVPW